MAIAVKGLSKEQALLALSTTKVNIEDQKTILIKSGVITKEEAETMAVFVNTTATETNTTAKTANLKVTNLLKVAYAKLKAVMLAHPLATITGALGLITVGVIKISKWFENAGKRAKEATEKSKDSLDQTKSEIAEINSSLQTTKARIEELNAKKYLSLVESEELAKLKEQNDELERELRIKEALAKTQDREANDKAVKYFNSKTNHVEYSTGKDTRMYVSDSDNYSLIDAVEKKLAKIPVMKQSLKDLQKQLDEIENTDPDYKNNSDWLKLKGNINRMETELKKYQNFVDESITDFMEMDDSLVSGIDDGILARLDTIYQSYDELTNGVAQSHTNIISGVLEKADFKNDKRALLELGKAGTLSVNTLSSKFPELIQYLDKAGISAQELYQHIMNLTNPDAVKYDELRHQLQDEMGFGDGIHTSWAADKHKQLQDLGLYSNDALEVFASIKAKYVNGETEMWNPDDWIKNIQDGLNGNPDSSISFEQAWSDSFSSENNTVKELGNSLLELAEQGHLTIETFSKTDSTGYFKNLGISADEAVTKINNLADESKQLSSMAGQISSMTDALNSKQKNGFVSADTLSGFDAEVRGLESWDRFQNLLVVCP